MSLRQLPRRQQRGALALGQAGFDIALVDLREADMKATAAEIEARGERTPAFPADVSEFTRAHAIVDEIAAKGASSMCCSTMPARRARGR
jgi:short-subunit dehydrogenase